MVGLVLRRSNAGQTRAYTGIQLQTSAQGVTVPVLYGTSRQTVNLIWYKNFRAVQTGSGGKGGLAGAAGKQTGNQYAYYADVILALGEGPIQDVGQAWASKTPTTTSALGLTLFTGTYPQVAWGYVTSNYPTEARPYTGLAYLAAASYQLGSAAELPQHTFEVYGVYSQRSVYTATAIPSAGPFTLTMGSRTWGDGSVHSMWVANVSIPGFTLVGGAPGAGQYSVAAGVYTFNAADAGTAITIQWTGKGQDADPSLVANDILTNVNYGISFTPARVGELTAYSQSTAIPGGLTITVTHAAQFDDNLSVYDAANDQLFTCVAASPGPLQYTYTSGGVYAFNVADLGKTVTISYAALGGLDTFQAYCWAAGLFVSPAYLTQVAAASALDDLARFCNSEIVISAGALKLVPRGDTALTGSGFTYTPPSVVADLSDDDFQSNEISGGASGALSGNDPVILTRKRIADQKNVVQIEAIDRSNQYNSSVVEATDQAMVDLYGRRTTGSEMAHLFTDTTVAKQSAQLLLQREGVRNQYAFVLPATFLYLDPMDLITLTDTRLGLSTSDVQRIISIEEQADGGLHVVAEEYLTGLGSAASYQFQTSAGYVPNYNVDPGSINTPILFEAPAELASNGGLQIFGAFSGASAEWGGCDIYVSSDGVTYNFVGRKWGASRQGLLAGATFSPPQGVPAISFDSAIHSVRDLPAVFGNQGSTAGSRAANQGWSNLVRRPRRLLTWTPGGPTTPGTDPDTFNALNVDLTESFGALTSGTASDADQGHTACIVDSEILAFSAATLTAPYNYRLDTYLRRGLYQTGIATHFAGAPFARLDELIFAFPYNADQIGQTIYVKACSFNKYGGGLQDLSIATAYPHTIVGPPTPGVVTGFSAAQSGLAVYLSWTDLTDRSIKGYDLLYGPQGGSVATAALLSQTSRTTETTTVQIGPGNWTFYIRGRNSADQTGPVSQVSVSISEFSQLFQVSGTWTKPGGIKSTTLVFVELWGGGASGGSGVTTGGGGGSAYVAAFFLASALPNVVSVTVGAGGTAVTNANGLAGGRSFFGAFLTGFGGGGGGNILQSAGGGGGGVQSDGETVTSGAAAGGSPLGGAGGNPGGTSTDGGGGGGTPGGALGGAAVRGGGGGGGGNGGNSTFGGAGGGGYNNGPTIYTGGTSVIGGNGGNANPSGNGFPGQQPGGGGGACQTANTSGAGGAGMCRVTVLT